MPPGEKKERKKYPIRADEYQLLETVGVGVSAVVHRAECLPFHEIVAIKVLDFERHNSDLSNIAREAQTMVLIDHPHVLNAHCSFVNGHNLWVVMPFMAGGSCLHIMKSVYPDGFEEVVIATVLRDVLKGLEYLHNHGHIHRDVKAGNILVDTRGGIKLGDFGVSACLFESGDRQRMRNTFVGTPCWMAPEVMEQSNGYDYKADIWSFGITALELAHGHAPFSKYPPMKVLLMTLQNAPPGLDYERDRKFSKSFKQMIAMCLVKNPSKRPTASKLLKQPFFKQAKTPEYLGRKILEGLPTLGDRYQALKEKEEELLAQKKIPDGRKEELSQNEYKRGISSWNFDVEDLKAQAALIPDEDIPCKDPEECQNPLSELDTLHESMRAGISSTCCSLKDENVENIGVMQNKSALPQSPDQMACYQRSQSNESDNGPKEASSNDQNNMQNGVQLHCLSGAKGTDEKQLESVPTHTIHERRASMSSSSSDILRLSKIERSQSNGTDNGPKEASSNDRSNMQNDVQLHVLSGDKGTDEKKQLEGVPIRTIHERRASMSSSSSDILRLTKIESFKQQNHLQDMANCNGAGSHTGSDTSNEATPKTSKSIVANSDELDEKAKPPVVQQRGRFKVTSDNSDVDKALPPLGLQKSYSVQVISQASSSLLSPTGHLPNLGNSVFQSPTGPSPNPGSSVFQSPTGPSPNAGSSVFQQLHGILQTNILQRDNILNLMKQLSTNEPPVNRPAEGVSLSVPRVITEKSLLQLDASNEREKDLIQEISDLQWRVVCLQDELQKLKTKNTQV